MKAYRSKTPFLFFVLFLIIACSDNDKQQKTDTASKKGRILQYTQKVSFLSAENDTLVTIDVAVADNKNERNQGLMDVHNLPRDKGMLFIFEDNQPRSFWMANTPLSLDIFFINEDFEIVRIHRNAKPYSRENLTSDKPAKYVVETNAGFSISHDIQEGMRISL